MKTDLLAPQIETRIFLIRGQKIMFSHHLAALYGVETKVLNQAVRRNSDRFPEDFVFQLNEAEWADLKLHSADVIDLKSQIVTSKGRGGSRVLPYAFTEQGVAMLSSVLRSPRAVQVNVAIIRAFVRLRELLMTHADLAKKLEAMEQTYDSQFKVVFDALRQLMTPPAKPRREIGFHAIPKPPAATPGPKAKKQQRGK